MFLIIIELLLVLILSLFILLFIWEIFSHMKTKVPFIPVSGKVVARIVEELKLKDGEKIYDLGCGDGRVLFACKKSNNKVSCVGVEKAPIPLLWAWLRNFFSKKSDKIKVLNEDFFAVDLREANKIFLYLFPEMMDKLFPKLEKELRKGVLAVSCDFQFFQKKPREIIDLGREGKLCRKLYIYEF